MLDSVDRQETVDFRRPTSPGKIIEGLGPKVQGVIVAMLTDTLQPPIDSARCPLRVTRVVFDPFPWISARPPQAPNSRVFGNRCCGPSSDIFTTPDLVSFVHRPQAFPYLFGRHRHPTAEAGRPYRDVRPCLC